MTAWVIYVTSSHSHLPTTCLLEAKSNMRPTSTRPRSNVQSFMLVGGDCPSVDWAPWAEILYLCSRGESRWLQSRAPRRGAREEPFFTSPGLWAHQAYFGSCSTTWVSLSKPFSHLYFEICWNWEPLRQVRISYP